MSCEMTLWVEKPELQSAQFLLLTWGNWVEDTEDEDDWVEGYGAEGSQRFECWERHNHDSWNSEYYGAQLFQEWEHCERDNGRGWLTSCGAHSRLFWKERFLVNEKLAWIYITFIILPSNVGFTSNITSFELMRHNFCQQMAHIEQEDATNPSLRWQFVCTYTGKTILDLSWWGAGYFCQTTFFFFFSF